MSILSGTKHNLIWSALEVKTGNVKDALVKSG